MIFNFHSFLKKTSLLLGCAILFAGTQQAHAQLANNYTFTHSNSAYVPITGGTVLINGTSTTSLDSWTSPAFTIPLVSINNVSYTTAYMTSNGLLKLGGNAPSSSLYTGISTSPEAGSIHICPFNADLNNVFSTSASEIRWQDVGTEVVFQWKSFCRYAETENFDFQVRINKNSGVVKFCYNLNSGPGTGTSYLPQVGIAEANTANNYINRLVDTIAGQNWNNSVDGTANDNTCRFTANATHPKSFVSGQNYIFTPTLVCTMPNPGATIASATTNVCANSLINFSLQNPTPGAVVTYQWQGSNDNISYSDISGAINANAAINASYLYYRCKVTCRATNDSVYSTPVQLSFANNINTVTNGTRCGTGTVNLSATSSTGTTLKWYNNISGGTALGTGNNFTTPIISSTTPYYVEASSTAPIPIRIGDGTTSMINNLYPNPFSGHYGGTKHQMLFLASELIAQGMSAGNITAIAFDINEINSSSACNDFTIKMGTTTNTSLSGFVTGTSTVYNQTFTPSTTGLINFTFTTPFNWNGTDNIIIETIHNAGNSGNGNGTTVQYTPTSFNSVYARYADNVTPATAAGFDASTSGSTTTSINRPNIVFSGIGHCASLRKQVVATVNTAPAFDITNDKTVCNNNIVPLAVLTPTANYDNVTWSPVTNLFTNAAGTIPYTAGTQAQTVYYKSTTSGTTTYTATALNTTTLCGAVDSVKIQNLPQNAAATTAVKLFCTTGSTTFSVSPTINQANVGYQWQSSTDNLTFTNIAGANNTTYTTPQTTTTTYYRAEIKNSDGNLCFHSSSDTIIIKNASVISSTGAERCGTGTLNLSATTNAGYTLKWYNSATGGTAIGTGANFTTPTIAATTTYYAESSIPIPTKVRLGNGTASIAVNSYPNPFSGHYGGTKHQMLFLASELTAQGLGAGNISAISFDVNAINSNGVCNDFTIRVGTTTNTALTGFVSGTTTVYNQTFTPTAVGLTTFNFTTPFNWNGTDNIIIETVHNAGSGGNVSGTSVQYTPTSFNSVFVRYADNVTPATAAAFDATTAGGTTISTDRPNIVFTGFSPCVGPRVPVVATVKPKPTATLLPSGTVNICQGFQDTLNATGSGTYSWLRNNVLQAGQTNSSLIVNIGGNYKAIVTSANGCKDTSAAAVVMLRSSPVVNLGNDTSYCANVNYALNAGNPGATYKWDNNSTSQTRIVNASGQYSVLVTNTYGCKAADTIQIQIQPVPIVNLGNDTAICASLPLTLNAQNPGASYLWNTGATSQTINVSVPGTYSVGVTNANNCKGRDTIVVSTMAPVQNLGFNFVPLFQIARGRVKFIPLTQNPNYHYTWSFGDGTTSTQMISEHTYAQSGNYPVSLKIKDSCTQAIETLQINVDLLSNSLKNVSKERLLANIYPNPANKKLNIEILSDNSTLKHIDVYNIVGKKEISLPIERKGVKSEVIDLQNLSSGTYIINITTNDGSINRKFEVIK